MIDACDFAQASILYEHRMNREFQQPQPEELEQRSLISTPFLPLDLSSAEVAKAVRAEKRKAAQALVNTLQFATEQQESVDALMKTLLREKGSTVVIERAE